MKIKVKKCYAHGPQFANLTPGSVHEVIKEDKGRKDPNKVHKMINAGVWVAGIGEEVKLLAEEYEIID